MEDDVAFQVESALIDAYPGLTNIAGGTGSNDYGAMHAIEIISRYTAPPAEFQHRALLISVNRSATETSLYEATRYAWKLKKSKAEQAEVVLATRQGEIVGAFIPRRWLEATAENFPGRSLHRGDLVLRARKHPSRLSPSTLANECRMNTVSPVLRIR